MRKRLVLRTSTSVALLLMLLLLLGAGLAFAGVIIRATPRVAAQAVAVQRVQLPSPILHRLQATKPRANMELIAQTYFVRNNIPYIRLAQAEFQLLTHEQMAYDPTPTEIQKSQALTGHVLQYRPWIIPLQAVQVPTGPPSAVDHRPNQTPIKSQSPRGTCVCFASMAGLEVAYGGGSLDLSEQYANWVYMTAEGRSCKEAGLQTHNSANYLAAHGVSTESVCPYQTSFAAWCNNGGSPPPTVRANADSNSPYQISSYQKIWRNDELVTDTGAWINNPRYLEGILASGKDIVFGTKVAGWTTASMAGVVDVQLNASGDPLPSVGGHAILLVGYNRTGQYFIAKNSWGTGRGHAGYVYLSYDYIRTYAKYGYYITDVHPIPLIMHRPMLRAIPMMRQNTD